MNKVIYSKEQQRLAKKLIKARLEASLTQEQVARSFRVTQSYISKLESGQRKIDMVTLKKFASKYGKNMTYFL